MIGLIFPQELMLMKPKSQVHHFQVFYFLKINFRFLLKVCDDCHYIMQKAVIFNDFEIAFVKGNDFRIHVLYIRKDEAIYLLKKCWFD